MTIWADRVKETTATIGTGALSLAGAEAGHQGIVAAIGDGNSSSFCVTDGTDWEVFEGTATGGSPDTLSRDTILASSNSGYAVDWGSGSKDVFLVVPASAITDFDSRLKTISSNTTFYVSTTGSDTTGDGSSGSPWATPHKALDYLGDYFWNISTTTVTIQCGDGTYTFTEAIEPKHICGNGLKIVGENTYSKSMTSVQSYTGSAGAWSITVNLNDVTNIAADDYVIIHSASGGTRPTFIEGCHKVTNVDSGNSRISFSSKHQHASAPSGSVAATVIVIKTIFDFDGTTYGYYATSENFGGFDKCVLAGDGVTSGSVGVYVEACLLLLGTDSVFGVVNWDGCNIRVLSGGKIISNGIVASSGALDDSVRLEYQAGLSVSTRLIISGHVDWGCFVSGNSFLRVAGTGVFTGGGDDNLYVSTKSLAIVADLVSTGCADKGVNAYRGATVVSGSQTVSDNGTDYSPVVNTEGNDLSYIYTSF